MEHRLAIPDNRRALRLRADRDALLCVRWSVQWDASARRQPPGLATGMWQSRAAMPFTSEAPTCALMASTGIVYCTEGDTGSGFASYNIATDTWTPLASIPGGITTDQLRVRSMARCL